MSNTYLDKAIEAVPRFAERISLFTKKLRLAQYADSTIYSYRLKISQAVLYLGVNHHFDVNLIFSKLRTKQF